MAEFDVQTALQGSVEDIGKGFGALTDENLAAMHKAESAAEKPRTTLTKAIEAEQAGRVATRQADAEAAKAKAAEQGIELYTKAEVDALIEPHTKRLDELEKQLTKAKGSVAARAVADKPRVLSVTGEGDGEALRVAFTDADDRTLAGLPDLEFDPSAFTTDAKGETVTLKERISFDEATPRSDIAKVWLVGENGKGVACIKLVNPLPVGGGTSGCIPSGHLAFRLPEKAAAKE